MVFFLLCFLFRIVLWFQRKIQAEPNIFCGVVTWISVCSLPPGAPQQLPKAPTQNYPHSRRFIQHSAHGVIQKTWAFRCPSQAHPPRCGKHRAPLSVPQQCIPSSKPKDDGEMRDQVLRCKSCSCSHHRAGLICAMGAREASRAMTTMLPEPPGPRRLPFV